MKKILITGGCGFIGHHLIEHVFKNTNQDIIIIDKLNYASKGYDRLRNNYPDIKSIIAEIKSTNIPSIKSFTNNNFIYQKFYLLNNETINIYIYSIK